MSWKNSIVMQGCIIKGLFPGNVKKLYREIENHGIMKIPGIQAA